MTKAPTPTEMSKGQSDNTNNATKKFDLTAIHIHLFQDILKRILFPEFHARLELHLCQRLGRHWVNDWLGNLGKKKLIS